MSFLSGLRDFFLGTPDQFQQMPKFEPQQQEAFNQLLQNVLPQILSGQLPTQGFEPIAQREVQRFQQETVPTLAERFTGMGAGAQGSSGFQEALARGGSQLGTDLAAMGSQFGLQRQGQLMQLLGMGLTPQQENFFMPGKTGFLGALAPGLGTGIGYGLMGPVGGLLGFGGQQQQGAAPGSVSVRR